ncbi:MAG: response regulator [Acidobacteria bacterium]|nr:response regulator [Acidobacteriota bacterium]
MADDGVSPLKLMVVDDDREVLDVFKILVSPLGYDVVGLSDSREAAQRVMTDKFDMIAVDVYMPDLNGFELTTRIRASQSNHDVPILMFTGYDDIETMLKGFDVGISFYLAKPLSASKIRGLFAAARGTMLEEQRRGLRLPLSIDVDCRSVGRYLRLRSVNLAPRGMLLEGSCGLKRDDTVHLEFVLPGTSKPLELLAKVVRKVEPDFVALEFVDPSMPAQAALRSYFTSKVRD